MSRRCSSSGKSSISSPSGPCRMGPFLWAGLSLSREAQSSRFGSDARKIDTGHCDFQIRPLGLETGQYPILDAHQQKSRPTSMFWANFTPAAQLTDADRHKDM